ncbi:hypothetical protein [Bradyrhizobium sp. CCBAU 53421]|uniref:hypothetical protein n=1 Tax=Bradyrhizobium sp. CCBAU 53421 TaxID=1325120 RepID=UPI001AEE4AD8|nr:hypothetical protein [Bradyrhizobium sp. CCBAU 53421]
MIIDGAMACAAERALIGYHIVAALQRWHVQGALGHAQDIPPKLPDRRKICCLIDRGSQSVSTGREY